MVKTQIPMRLQQGTIQLRAETPAIVPYSQYLVQMDEELLVGAPLVGALFGPNRSKTRPIEGPGAGTLPLRRRNFGSGYNSDREVSAVSVQEEGPRRWVSFRKKLL